MKPEAIFVGGSLCGLVIIIGMFFVVETSQNYDVPLDNSSFSRATEKAVAVYALGGEIQGKLEGETVSESSAFDNILSGSYLALRSLMGSIGILGSIITVIAKELPFVHPVIIGTLIAIGIISFFMSIVYLAFRVLRT